MVKRIFDIVLSLIGLIVLWPLFLVVAVLIKLDSKGPVLFRQLRIRRGGKPFQMLKFRTMMETKHWMGPGVSPRNDPRVTSLGVILRRFKVNEFPQLINVLKGDMSFVGPRPEVPEFVSLYSPEENRILSVKPGVVGPSQIQMRNEEELYIEDADPKEYYVKHILPKKLRIDLDYVQGRSFLRDMKYLLQGIAITITGAITRRHLFENAEQITLFGLDTVLCGFSYFLSYYLRMEGEFPLIERATLLHSLPYIIIVRMIAFTYFGLYATLIRHVSFHELLRVIKGATVSSVLFVLLVFFIGERSHPRSVFIIDWFVIIFLVGGYRIAFEVVRDHSKQNKTDSAKNVLIYGAGPMGDLALRYLRMQGDRKVVAFIDDNPKKMRKSFQGIKVLGNRYDIEALSRLYYIDQILIAKKNMIPEDLENIKTLCKQANVEYEIFSLAN
jgi:lipopolysaccharide/colanic/teichoic acid biosynthesis glycosyltransferase